MSQTAVALKPAAQPLDVLAAFTTEPPPHDFVFPGLLAGTVGVLMGPGGSFKSTLALQMAVGVASNHAAANSTGLSIEKHGKVVYVNLEDPPGEIARKLHALGGRLDMLTRQSVAEGLKIYPRKGIPSDIMNPVFREWLLTVSEGARLVIVDTFVRSHSMDENSNGDMSQVVGSYEQVSLKTGSAFLLPHHVSKAAALNGLGDNQNASRGASALIDNARYAANLVKLSRGDVANWTDDHGRPIPEDRTGAYVHFSVSRNSYGPSPSAQWYERRAGGLLHPVNLLAVSNATRKKEAGRHAPAQY